MWGFIWASVELHRTTKKNILYFLTKKTLKEARPTRLSPSLYIFFNFLKRRTMLEVTENGPLVFLFV
jgi:hypothetical protein